MLEDRVHSAVDVYGWGAQDQDSNVSSDIFSYIGFLVKVFSSTRCPTKIYLILKLDFEL